MTVCLDHIQIAIPEGGETRAREFWTGLVGLEEIAKPPALAARGGCWFTLDGSELHLGIEDPFAPAQKAHPGFRLPELDDLARKLATAGHPIDWDEKNRNRRRFFTHDPFGNRLEFLS